MNPFDDIKLYLPKYLSVDAQENLFAELRQFPDNIQDNLYTTYLDDDPDIFQGDGLESLFIVDLPDARIKEGPVMVVTNTCDTSQENRRMFAPRLVYCPIMRLSRYEDYLRDHEHMREEAISDRIRAIKQQQLSSVFYLPPNARLTEDYIALLDRLNNCDMNYLNENPEKKRKIFTLSNYGFYMFLIKLSIHLTRVREDVDRG
jgi:hypothetical protein